MAESPELLAGLRIVVIDDNYLLATSVAAVLQFVGGDVIATLPSLDDGMRFFSAEAPGVDAAVLDVDLGGTPSYPLADLLDERGIPFLFVTGYDSSALDPKYQDRVVCIKPVLPELLCKEIARLCGRSG